VGIAVRGTGHPYRRIPVHARRVLHDEVRQRRLHVAGSDLQALHQLQLHGAAQVGHRFVVGHRLELQLTRDGQGPELVAIDHCLIRAAGPCQPTIRATIVGVAGLPAEHIEPIGIPAHIVIRPPLLADRELAAFAEVGPDVA
jgi:hypothetical protein